MRVHSPFASAFTPGTRYLKEREGRIEMELRVIGELDVPTGRICVSDPGTTSFEGPHSPLARRAPTGRFPVEVALARFEDQARVACARVRFAAGPAVTWEHATFEGGGAPGPDEVAGYGVDAGMGCFFDAASNAEVDEATMDAWLAAMEANQASSWTWHEAKVGSTNVVMFSSGWGDGFYASYWGLDAEGNIVELVTDFELLIGPISERFELALPLKRGLVMHPLLDEHDVTMRVPFFSRSSVLLGGKGSARVELSDGSPVTMKRELIGRRYAWEKPKPGAQLVVCVLTKIEPLQPIA